MRTGELDKLIEIQAPSKVPDGMGGFTQSFKTVFTVWGSIWPLNGQEAIAAMQAGGTITHRIRIRFKPVNIRTSWRIKYGDKYFNIASPPVNLGGENRWMEFKVKEAA
jgi:SPP1 family predicted phage head-tail adaptor